MDPTGVFIFAIVVVILIAPLFGLSAYARMKRMEKTTGVIPDLIARIYALEKRVAEMERKPAAPPVEAPSMVPPHAPVAPPPAAAPPRAERPAPPVALRPSLEPVPVMPREPQRRAPTERRLDLETLIAGRWLNRIGILALLLAVSFFIKYAFDNNWVGPRGRVAIGLLLGAGLVTWSGWLLRRGYRYFSEGIAGLGAAILYLSLWAGWHYYSLFSSAGAFGGMVVVTAAMLAVALGRDSQRIALLALVGGFLTPELVSTGKDQQVILFSYLAVLAAAMLFLARWRNWQTLAPLSFIAVQIYFWGWYDRFYGEETLLRTSLFATLFFVQFAALPLARSRREGRLSEAEIGIVLFNVFAYVLALRAMLWPEHRWELTVAVLALGAAHQLVAQSLPPPMAGEKPVAKMLFAGLALTLVTLAIPIRLDGKWITMAWAIEGAVLLWSGLRIKLFPLRAAGYLLFMVAAFRLVAFPIHAERLLLNARFAAYAVVVASFAAALWFARRQLADLGESEGGLLVLLGIATNVFALAALSLEAWDWFGRMQTLGLSRALAQQLALSMVWTLYATGLLLAGMKRAVALLRWQALALFGIVVGKVFFFDLSFLDRFYRIVSFLVVGAVLLAVSFLYQRKLAAGKEEKTP